MVFSMHPFSVFRVKYTLSKDNVFKLNIKHEFVQLDRLNIKLNVEEAFKILRCIPSFVGNKMHFPIPKCWELSFHSHSQSQKLGIKFFIPIPNPKSWELDSQCQKLGLGLAISHSQSQI